MRDCPVDDKKRYVPADEANPYSMAQRLQMIRAAFEGDDLIAFPMPDIAKIHIGRAVGYGIEHHQAVEGYSGSTLRAIACKGDPQWRQMVSDPVARILEEIGGLP